MSVDDEKTSELVKDSLNAEFNDDVAIAAKRYTDRLKFFQTYGKKLIEFYNALAPTGLIYDRDAHTYVKSACMFGLHHTVKIEHLRLLRKAGFRFKIENSPHNVDNRRDAPPNSAMFYIKIEELPTITLEISRVIKDGSRCKIVTKTYESTQVVCSID